MGHTGIAITEHETIANAIEIEEYWDKIKENNPTFKIIKGNEIYLVRNGLNANNFNKEYDKYTHFILLALDAEGHKQIREISTRAWLRSYISRGMRRVPTYYQDLIDIIGNNKGHVIGMTACIGGALGTQLLKYRELKDEKILLKIKKWCIQINEIFGENNFYLEMQPSNNIDQKYVNRWIIKLSNELGIPFTITNDAHYLKKEDLKVEKIFLNSQGGDREVESFYASTYLMDTSEVSSYMTELSEEDLQQAFINIQTILDRAVNYSLKKPLRIPSLPWRSTINYQTEYSEWFVRMPTLQKFLNSTYESDKYLVDAVIDGIKHHPDLQNDEAYKELELCLQDTWVSSEKNNAQWSAYFLNLQKVIDVCWEAGTVVGCGRGSGVGFLLLYCLDITQINPLREATKTFRFRFLNPERVSVLDIDTDITGINRSSVLNYIRKYYGQDKVANVLTLRTEKSKSAILAAARGLGIDIDIAQYISSLIPSERGLIWPLTDCMYGNQDEGRQPIKQFVYEMTENHPEIWEVVKKTENLIVGMGEHAGGLVLVDEPFTESTALMRAPNGDVMTQFELHTAEKASLIKLDMLSVEAIDKIQVCIQLLQEYGYIDPNLSLREAYESTIGIYNLERKSKQMWDMINNHQINALFQLTQQSGINGIEVLHPTSVDDLSVLNSAIRLMAQEKGGEMPVNKLARFKNNPSDWDEEIISHGLDPDKTKLLLAPVLSTSYGLCIAQEQFMQLVQMPELGGMTLTQSDALRKSIAKKNPEAYEKWIDDYRQICSEKKIDSKLIDYVVELIGMSKGYGFNQSHTLAYSLIALQEMNLAYKYPIVFWNCACLINDSGGADNEEEDEENVELEEEKYYNEMEEFGEDDKEEDIESSYEEEDCDGYPAEVVVMTSGKKKKKVKVTNYGKIATAIGKMKSEGINVTLPDINKSAFTFTPDPENNSIIYGLSGITRVSADLIKKIIDGRPYISFDDFYERIHPNALQTINLVKSGAFDSFDSRDAIMRTYLIKIADLKKTVNLRNMQMLINYRLLPDELAFEIKVFNFNKYLKKMKQDIYYGLDNIAFNFFSESFDVDLCTTCNDTESGFQIKQTIWDGIYKKYMDKCRTYIKNNHNELLKLLNDALYEEVYNKYAKGDLSSWEMDSVSFYSHDHELKNINGYDLHLSNYFDMSENPEIDRIVPIKGKMIPLYKIKRIAGTILDKDKNKKTVTLLTTDGVVTVSIFGQVFAQYDKQISRKDVNGKKHVIERSWLSRGNKVIISGVRQGDKFNAKKYSSTPWHLVELIETISDDGTCLIKSERAEE